MAPQWSADGRWLAWATEKGNTVDRLELGQDRVLSSRAHTGVCSVAWSKDGRRLPVSRRDARGRLVSPT